ncbi:hypothetical protein [Leucothrix pacifica]|uniref:Uncharacterized protein n=1 Tax=Leucothrix pacifica TaxID=1247513 RepID=A0A317CAG7_9GAMM|nr:hypothetical protein [Leucothrix pacifica]PWQ95604.1 hypothetical protein DKW60_14390 [Leucothrix pacifica]
MTDKYRRPEAQTTPQTISENDLDELLGNVDFAEVPEGFTQQVMQEIDQLPTPVATDQKTQWWQWAALISGGIPALFQLLAFIFSAWNVASLG